MYLIWRMDSTAKGAKKNTSPNVIHLQYVAFLTSLSRIFPTYGDVSIEIIAAKFKPMLSTDGLKAGRDLYCDAKPQSSRFHPKNYPI